MKTTFEDFVSKAQQTHNNKYIYVNENYYGISKKITAICPYHGEFQQLGSDHLKGFGCRKCASEKTADQNRMSQKDFLKRCKDVHGDRYDYSKSIYKNNETKVIIICKEHGEFQQAPAMHFCGNNCPRCAQLARKESLSESIDDFITKAYAVHGNKYDYVKIYHVNGERVVDIKCKEHGIHTQNASNHLFDHGCPQCGYKKLGLSKRLSQEAYIARAKEKYGNTYDYTKTVYQGMNTPVIITCTKHGDFEIIASWHTQGNCGCPKCSQNGTSSLETTLSQYFDSIGIKYNHREKLKLDEKSIEVDFYIPSKKLAIEVDGRYWHSELAGRNRNYHLSKTLFCEKLNIQLIHIFEDEFRDIDLLKSRLQNLLRPDLNKRVFARKCSIKKITDKRVKSEFLSMNHLQGNDNSQVCYGLYHDDSLISMMTFAKKRKCFGYKNNDGWELVRFCSLKGYNVIAAASRLLKHFEDEFTPSFITTFADRRWSVGNLYKNLGFTLSHTSEPSYWYFNDGNALYHRFCFHKKVLQKKLIHFNPNLTEWENMQANGYNRIWDCGQYIFTK